MGSPSSLAERMDFSVGKKFERDVLHRFGVQVHHDSPSPRGSSLLLATFHRFLFPSYGGQCGVSRPILFGRPCFFVPCGRNESQSLPFSVSCKAVGFFVYALRRVIGASFDVYFHLWTNGAPHWEREKRLWEEEEAKKWTKVLSKCQKNDAKSKSSVGKRVRFASQVAVNSPVKKFAPVLPKGQSILFGTFKASVAPLGVHLQSFVFGSSESVLGNSVDSPGSSSVQSVVQQSPGVTRFPKSALKKATVDDSLNLGSSPVGNTN